MVGGWVLGRDERRRRVGKVEETEADDVFFNSLVRWRKGENEEAMYVSKQDREKQE